MWTLGDAGSYYTPDRIASYEYALTVLCRSWVWMNGEARQTAAMIRDPWDQTRSTKWYNVRPVRLAAQSVRAHTLDPSGPLKYNLEQVQEVLVWARPDD